MRDFLRNIREPEEITLKKSILSSVLVLFLGIILGIFSKWLDDLALDSTVWWHRPLEFLNLSAVFSNLTVWLLLALCIAVFSSSPKKAALNTFLFFAGMCIAYHTYTVFISGFNPYRYMTYWYLITLFTPIPAVICWYGKGRGIVSLVVSLIILAILAVYCYYLRSILSIIIFMAAVAVLYRNPKTIMGDK